MSAVSQAPLLNHICSRSGWQLRMRVGSVEMGGDDCSENVGMAYHTLFV